jgi:hypothetical protein
MSRTRRRSPEVRSTAFTARPPDLPPRLLMAVDFAITCSLVQPGRPRYPVLVHQAAALLRASFRPRLAAAPLRFANPSPPSGWIEDFHLQALDHARHTRKRPRGSGLSLALDGPSEVHAQGRRIWGGECPRGTLRKHRSEGYPAFTLFQSCFVKKKKWFRRDARPWAVVSAPHSAPAGAHLWGAVTSTRATWRST